MSACRKAKRKGEKMRKTIFVIGASALLLATKVCAYDDGDFQIWNTDVEEFKVDDDSKIAFEEEFRWGNDSKEFYYQHYDAGFFYNLREWLNIGSGYRQVFESVKGKFKAENEPYAAATLLCDLEGFRFEDRNRMEYREFDYKDDHWRYRNKATLKLPWKFTRMDIQPYISDEIFIVFGGVPGELNQNRFSPGLGANLTRNVKADIYYMLQSSKGRGKWVDANVLGAKVKITF